MSDNKQHKPPAPLPQPMAKSPKAPVELSALREEIQAARADIATMRTDLAMVLGLLERIVTRGSQPDEEDDRCRPVSLAADSEDETDEEDAPRYLSPVDTRALFSVPVRRVPPTPIVLGGERPPVQQGEGGTDG